MHPLIHSFNIYSVPTYQGVYVTSGKGLALKYLRKQKKRKGEKGEKTLARTWKGRDTLHKQKWRTERETMANTWRQQIINYKCYKIGRLHRIMRS